MSSTILVVEDEPAIAELVAVNLSFAGHKVLRAADTIAADTLIRAELPDLVLNLESPSRGIDLLDSWRNLTQLNKCEKTSSATDFDDAAGVLIT